MASKPPTTVQGFPVLASRESHHGEDNYVILVERDDRITPWVTAVWSPRTGEEWVWGHYFSDRSKALFDFQTR